MLDRIREIPGDVLDHRSYHDDFARETANLRGRIWKLERSQTFKEIGDPSWDAFIAGDWGHALDLLDKDRDAVRADAERNSDQGLEIRRVRVVERPLSPYVQWELHALRMLAEEGLGVNVIEAARLSALEVRGRLPEVVVIDDRVLYEVRYEPDWTPCGARRIRAPEVIRSAAREIAELYHRGEPLLGFFDRELTALPAPAV